MFLSILICTVALCVSWSAVRVFCGPLTGCVVLVSRSSCGISLGSLGSLVAVNLLQDFRLLSICPMLFCFRLFYFRFKSFLRAELKCDLWRTC